MTSGLTVIAAGTVRQVLAADQGRVLELVEQAYRLHGSGDTVNPPSCFLRFPDRPNARIIALPAAVGGDIDSAGIKWISSFPDNLHQGLPRASAVLILNDRATGFPVACIEGSIISATRTAASAALAASRLGRSRRPVRRVGFVGGGLIARYVLSYLHAAGIPIQEVRVSDLDPARAAGFAADAVAGGTSAEVSDSVGELISTCDLVVFATTASTPWVTDPDWFGHHPLVLHLSLRDIAPELVLTSSNVLDDVEHCLTAGTAPHLAEQQAGHRRFIDATLPDVLAGRYEAPADRTVIFSPFGLGVLDLVLGRHVHEQALAGGVATAVPDFFDGVHPDGTPPRPAAAPPARPVTTQESTWS